MKKHIFYYTALLLMCLVTVILVKVLSFSQQSQFLVIVVLGFFYALWGILHHILHHSLRIRIVIEYIIIAMLGVAVIVFVLKGII